MQRSDPRPLQGNDRYGPATRAPDAAELRPAGRNLGGRGRKGLEGAGPAAAASMAPLSAPERSGAPLAWAILFLISLLFPLRIQLGPVLLLPYRLWLIVLFIPLCLMLVKGRAGGMKFIDWMMLGSSLWAALSLAVSDTFSMIVEPAGIYVLECFGAYALGRLTIRSAEDFHRMVKALFWIILILLPFAAAESITQRPILLNLMGEGNVAVNAGVRMELRRAQTVFEHPILYGAFVSTGLGVVWYSFSPTLDQGRRLLVASVIVAATFLSLSSGALMSLVVQIFFITWEACTRWSSNRWKIFGWGALVAYIIVDLLATASPFHVLVNYATFSSGSAYNRIRIWDYGTASVMAKPLFGLGLNGDWARPRWMSPSVDNFWLYTAMRYGLPCLVMMAIPVFVILRKVSKADLTDPLDKACRAGFLTSLGGIILAGGTVHYWKSIFVFVMFFIASGIWIFTGGKKTARVHQDSDDTGSDPPPRTGDVQKAGPRYSRF